MSPTPTSTVLGVAAGATPTPTPTPTPLTFAGVFSASNGTQFENNLTYKLTHVTDSQRFSFMLMGIYAVAILVLWNFPVLKHLLYPFKLITVAFHEFGHALAGKCTGARIESISVDPNEGGVTKMRGGRACCVLPAGYIGSAIIGSILIFCGFNTDASKVASCLIGICLLLTLWWAENWFTRGLTVAFLAIFPILWVFTPNGDGLVYIVLFLGVMSAMYSLWDIVEDLITRKVNSSDAAIFAERYGCPSRFWGVFWFFISLLFVAFSVFMALLVWS